MEASLLCPAHNVLNGYTFEEFLGSLLDHGEVQIIIRRERIEQFRNADVKVELPLGRD